MLNIQLLKMSTYGFKNIENEITLEFCNSTIQKGINKVNKIKGIYGYNGAGKSAIIGSIDLYRNIVLIDSFLNEAETIKRLDKLLNYKKQEFYISVIFLINKEIIEHRLKINKDSITKKYIISYEEILLHKGRTLNEKTESLFLRNNNQIPSKYDIENFLLNFNYSPYNSIVTEYVLNYIIKKGINYVSFKNTLPRIIAQIYLFSSRISIYLFNSDKYFNLSEIIKILKKIINTESNQEETEENEYSLEIVVYDKQKYELIIRENDLELFKEINNKLEQFIKLFKPELKKIDLDIRIDRDLFHIRRIFVYDDYNIDLEYESAGIKQLVDMFPYLLECANGGIAFIDEIDTCINSVYFEKLISFFMEYGKGQLIYTAHNIEPMSELKKSNKSITILGINNKIETYSQKGNYDPKNQYKNGYFSNLPMNIESFDFLNIFFGENK